MLSEKEYIYVRHRCMCVRIYIMFYVSVSNLVGFPMKYFIIMSEEEEYLKLNIQMSSLQTQC